MYESNRESLSQKNGGVKSKESEDKPLEKQTHDNSELDIFPALQKYKDEHSTANLKKLCIEVLDFCRSIYASTQSDGEREAFRNIMRKIEKI